MSTIVEQLQTIAENIPKVYEAGQRNGSGGLDAEKFCNALKGYASGSVVHLPDVSPIKHTIKCKALVGDDFVSPPFERTTNLDKLGLHFVDNGDGTLFLKGTCTTEATSAIIIKILSDLALPAGRYAISGCPEGGGMDTYRLACSVNNNYYYDTGNGFVFDITDNTSTVDLEIHVRGGVTVPGVVFRPSLKSIAPPTALVVQYGKNLAPPNLCAETYNNGVVVTPNADGSVTVDHSALTEGYASADLALRSANGVARSVILKANIPYTITVRKNGAVMDSGCFFHVNGISENPKSFVKKSNHDRILSSFGATFHATDSKKINTYSVQLEVGLEATDYVPYEEEVRVSNLDGTVEISYNSPTFGISSITPNTSLEVEYIRDIATALDLTLDNYVTSTDYPSSTKAGVVKVFNGSGIDIDSDGILKIYSASKSEIDSRNGYYRPIVPATLEYAVKSVTYDKAEIDTIVEEAFPLTPVPGAVILPETTSVVGAIESGVAVLPMISLNIGSRYWVTYNGTEYVCECVDYSGDGAPALGNLGGGYVAPFIIGVIDGVCACVPQDGSTSVTVSIIGVKMQVPLEQIPTVDVGTVLPLTYFEGEYTEEYGGYLYAGPGGLPMASGTAYEVFFDNKTYTCVAKEAVIEDMPFILLGNDMLFGGTSSEPFLVLTDAASMFALATFTEGEHVIKVTTPAKFVNGIAFSDTQIAAIEELIDAKLKELQNGN